MNLNRKLNSNNATSIEFLVRLLTSNEKFVEIIASQFIEYKKGREKKT